ncbi:MAG: hypothetical protein ACREFV_06425, partial [Acetobacteraceae bacterium]
MGGAASIATSSLAASNGAEPDALAALAALLDDDLARCNRTIVQRMQSPVPLIPSLAAHLVAAGGKRIRPLLTLATARLSGYPRGGEGPGAAR